MARGGNVKVRFTADTSGLSRGALVAQQDLSRLSSSGQKSMERLRTAALAAGTAGLGALVIGLKKSVDAAVEAEASQARLKAQLDALGISFRAHASEIDKVIQKHSQLSGLDDEDLQDAFTNIVRVTGNVSQSLRLTGLAADFARAKHLDVAKAGELVGKVAGGNTGILNRYGIKIREGASATEALGVLQRKFAGQAEAYGKTTAGAQDRFRVAVENLGEKIGSVLLPRLAKVADAATKFINEMQSGEGAGGRFAAKLKEVADRLAPIGKFLAEHPKLIAAAVAAWGAYKVASLAALAAIKVSTFRKAFGIGKAAAATEGAIAGRTYAAAFDAGSAAGLGKMQKSGKAIGALKALGRAWGPVLAAALWIEVANIIGDKTPELVEDTANESQRGVVRGPRRGGRGGPTQPRNQVGNVPSNNIPRDKKAFTGSVSKRGIVNTAGGGSRSLMAAGGGGPAVGTNAPGFSGGSGRRLSQPEIARVWVQAGGKRDMADLMSAIAMGESGGRTNAHNTVGEDSRGLWQINVGPGANTDFAGWNLFDPLTNARAAKAILARQGLNAWTVYSSGVYRQFLGGSRGAGGDARPVTGGSPSTGSGPSAAQQRRSEARARARERAREDRRFETPGTPENLEAGIAQSDVQIAQGNVRQGVTTRVNAIKARIARIRRALKGHLRPATRARLRSELAQLTTELAGLENPSRTLGPVTATEVPDTGGGGDGGGAPETDPAVEENNRLIAEQNRLLEQKIAIDQEIKDNQARILALTTQGKVIEASVGAMVNGWIGERLGPRFGLPGAPGVVAAYGGAL